MNEQVQDKRQWQTPMLMDLWQIGRLTMGQTFLGSSINNKASADTEFMITDPVTVYFGNPSGPTTT